MRINISLTTTRSTQEIENILETKTFKDKTVKFKGNTQLGYRQSLVEKIIENLEKRLNVDADLLTATKIGNLRLWPNVTEKTAIIGGSCMLHDDVNVLVFLLFAKVIYFSPFSCF